MDETVSRAGAWALILGASSGFGEATALALAQAGFNIAGVHLDRQSTIHNVERISGAVRAAGRDTLFFNVNAADPEKRGAVLDRVAERFREHPDHHLRVVMHSLAFGSLKPFISSETKGAITQKQMDMTLDVMANSLVYWVQDLVSRDLLAHGAHIFAMTSSGSTRVIPAYGAVSAAKAALESHVRQLAYELAPRKVTVNAIRAGVTDTAALRQIPGHERLLEEAAKRHADGRLTTPEDVATAIVALSRPQLAWMTGNVIGVDGGEDIAG